MTTDTGKLYAEASGHPQNKRNGGDLSETQMEALAFTFADHLRVKGELDEALNRLHLAEKLIAVNKIEIEGLRVELAQGHTRIESYQIERDRAVAERAKLAALLSVMHTAMHEAAIEEFVAPDAKQ
jgi:hypothetical protein